MIRKICETDDSKLKLLLVSLFGFPVSLTEYSLFSLTVASYQIVMLQLPAHDNSQSNAIIRNESSYCLHDSMSLFNLCLRHIINPIQCVLSKTKSQFMCLI